MSVGVGLRLSAAHKGAMAWAPETSPQLGERISETCPLRRPTIRRELLVERNGRLAAATRYTRA